MDIKADEALAAQPIFLNPESLIRQFESKSFREAVGRRTYLFDPMPAIDAERVGTLVWDLLAATKFNPTSLRLAAHGEIIQAPRRTVRGRSFADPRKLLEGLQDGETFNLNAVERLREDLRVISSALQQMFNVQVQANLYASYKGSTAGYKAHKDFHDVVVVQLSGIKRWTVYAPPPQRSSLRIRKPTELELQQATQLFTLTSGSCLYVPAGFVHDAATLDGVSVHLTYGIGCIRWLDIIEDVLAAAGDDVLYDRIPGDDAELLAEFEERVFPVLRGVFSRTALLEAVEQALAFGELASSAQFVRRAIAAPRTSGER
jgi:hypothetical protein